MIKNHLKLFKFTKKEFSILIKICDKLIEYSPKTKSNFQTRQALFLIIFCVSQMAFENSIDNETIWLNDYDDDEKISISMFATIRAESPTPARGGLVIRKV